MTRAQRMARHSAQLVKTRATIVPVLTGLLHSVQHDTPAALDAQVDRARRALDELWRAVGRITEP